MSSSVLLVLQEPDWLLLPLRKAGFIASSVSDLAGFVQMFDATHPDAIVIDDAMLDANGSRIFRLIQQQKEQPPLVLFTSTDEVTARARATVRSVDGDAIGVVSALGASAAQSLIADLKTRLGIPEVKRPRVMIVDDNESQRRAICAKLEGCGLEILEATAVVQATKMVANPKTRPELIILDVNMPNINGAQFCRFVKGNERFRSIRVLLCSALPPDRLRTVCADVGADGFVEKKAFAAKTILEELEQIHS